MGLDLTTVAVTTKYRPKSLSQRQVQPGPGFRAQASELPGWSPRGLAQGASCNIPESFGLEGTTLVEPAPGCRAPVGLVLREATV